MKDYKRFTDKDWKEWVDEEFYTSYEPSDEEINELYCRLAELEDKIENGTLIELPCKVGTIVYYVALTKSKFFKNHIVYDIVEMPFMLDMLGTYQNCWFLTKSETEQRLKELQNEI